MSRCTSILVVEDNCDTRELLVYVLTSAGFVVDQASNGAEALRKLKNKPEPTLVFLDMMMPVMNGWSFLKTSKSQNNIVITMSAVDWSHFDEPQEFPTVRGRIQKPLYREDVIAIAQGFCDRTATLGLAL